jgi:hypothetical protein
VQNFVECKVSVADGISMHYLPPVLCRQHLVKTHGAVEVTMFRSGADDETSSPDAFFSSELNRNSVIFVPPSEYILVRSYILLFVSHIMYHEYHSHGCHSPLTQDVKIFVFRC